MDRTHPSEIELLEYVEGELGDAQAARLRTHLASCAACAAAATELERAREVLRASPLLELSAGRRERILASLGDQERERRSPLVSLSPKRLLAVLAPAAAVAALVVTLTTVVGNGDQDQEASAERDATAEIAAAPAEAAPPAEPPPEASAGAAADEAGAPETPEAPMMEAKAPLTAEGTPAEVAEFLRAKGFDAKVVAGTVEVAGAKEDAVAKALEELGPGPVTVVVTPSG
jgi:anti-sigma factor RsiW